MIKKYKILSVFLVIKFVTFGQNKTKVSAQLYPESQTIEIEQTLRYKNESKDTLRTIYLSDWINSYATKSTALAKRFEEEFTTKFHLAKDEQRGYTIISKIIDSKGHKLGFKHLEDQIDVLTVHLKNPLLPGESYNLSFNYTVKLPDASFTDYGFTAENNYELKYWFLTPAVYDGTWQYYGNKNLDDLYIPKLDIEIDFTFPSEYNLTSELNTINVISNKLKTVKLKGKNRVDTYIQLHKNSDFKQVKTDDFTLVTNIKVKGVPLESEAILIDRITNFLSKNLGDYPHQRLLVSQIDYNKQPLYGLNQLPSLLRPFEDNFQFEMKVLKTALQKYISNIHLVNPRKDHWLNDALTIYFLAKYVEDFYPNAKFLGKLSNWWGIRAFHMADLDFNFRYFLYYMESARKNNDQAITTPKDSLTKFNANIAGRYKAALGLDYMDDFATDINLRTWLTNYLSTHSLKSSDTQNFEEHIRNSTSKDLDWFFGDYLSTRKKIDYKLMNVETEEDSISFTIKNKANINVPMALFSLKNEEIIDKIWLDSIGENQTFKIKNNGAERLVLDYDNKLPEFNQRNNYKSTNGNFFGSKPLQLRLFKDVEDPYYNQIFLMPVLEYNNIYDGITTGAKFYNKTILRKRLNYKFSPKYSINSRSLTGSGTISFTHNLENSNLFNITYGIDGTYRSFAQDAFFRRIRPNVSFTFRDKDDLRSDIRHSIRLRFIDIARTLGPDAIITELDTEPDYSVTNLRYVYRKPGLINFERAFADVQVASNFSKISASYEFRKLSKSNRNYNLRIFAGTFLKNNTDLSNNYFSFALDRPTDYLFDFNYLGRSEASGIFSQQIIIAEGGFKSQLDTPFANQWMTTANMSTSIWRYIQAYGDLGLIKSRGFKPKFVYDSGIRLNLVEDYFELFFPIYSNNGWEIAQPNYAEKIRFIITVDPQTLLGLFRRRWY